MYVYEHAVALHVGYTSAEQAEPEGTQAPAGFSAWLRQLCTSSITWLPKSGWSAFWDAWLKHLCRLFLAREAACVCLQNMML